MLFEQFAACDGQWVLRFLCLILLSCNKGGSARTVHTLQATFRLIPPKRAPGTPFPNTRKIRPPELPWPSWCTASALRAHCERTVWALRAHYVGTACALCGHCVRTMWALRAHCVGTACRSDTMKPSQGGMEETTLHFMWASQRSSYPW